MAKEACGGTERPGGGMPIKTKKQIDKKGKVGRYHCEEGVDLELGSCGGKL